MIVQGDDYKKCSVNPFSEGAQVFMDINLQLARKHKTYSQIKYSDNEDL